MNSRTTQILTASIVLAVTILAGSSTIKAEFFTNFDIVPKKIGPEQEIVSVRNTGLLQADNVIVQIIAGGTISSYADKCAEGEIHELIDNSTLVVKFLRMSPAVECNLELVVSTPTDLEVVVSSDGRLSPWELGKPWPSLPGFVILWMALMIVVYIIILLVVDTLLKNEICNRIEFWLREISRTLQHITKFKEAANAKKIVQFVKDEYDLKINNLDATVLELIYLQKTTMWQLRNHSKLSLQQVKYRVWKLRHYELVSKKVMKLDKTLEDYFKHPR